MIEQGIHPALGATFPLFHFSQEQRALGLAVGIVVSDHVMKNGVRVPATWVIGDASRASAMSSAGTSPSVDGTRTRVSSGPVVERS